MDVFQKKTKTVTALQITKTNWKEIIKFCGDDKWMLRIAKVCEGAWLIRNSAGSLCIDSDKGFTLLYKGVS
jgi:hypothetical protein